VKRTVSEDQSILVAVDRDGGGHIMATLGDGASEQVDECGTLIEDHGFETGEYPDESGIHVWGGTITVMSDDEDGYDVDWSGEWRRATVADLGAFGVPLG
jgi:hypothetical protein